MSRQSVVVYSDAAPASATMQIRILAPLGEAGIDIIDADCFRDCPDRLAQSLEQAAAVIVHRGIKKRCSLYDTLLAEARRRQVPVIYDIDDLLIDVHDRHPDRVFYQSRKLHALKPLLDADLAVASTQELAEALSHFQNMAVLPNRLPSKLWSFDNDSTPRHKAHDRGAPRTIGYIGSPTHAPDLELIEDAIIAVLDQQGTAVRFVSVGVPLSAKLRTHVRTRMLIPTKAVRQDYAEFARFAKTLSFDVGIAPLLDTPFNRCKSGIKFLEYAALGIPGVFSDLPPYGQVRHGENGLLASTPSQWAECLNRLLNSDDLCHTISSRASESLKSAGTTDNQPTWKQVIEQARHARQTTTSASQTSLSSIVDDLFDYETNLQQQLRWTFRFQFRNYYDRVRRKLAA